jgi:succinyl-diaminopimelate desuccinylase
MTDLVSLISKLIELPTSPGNAPALSGALDLVLGELSGYTIEHFESKDTKSALVHNQKTRPDKFGIILTVHLDTIPGKSDQLKPVIRDEKLYGLGVLDMKAAAACAITVFKEVAEKVDYPLALQFTTDEEVGGFNGTKHQLDSGVKTDFVIATEPTNLEIVTEAKGILQLKITAHGKAAHGAYPWKGQNAIWEMNQFMSSLRVEFPDPTPGAWATTINLGNIETSNRSFNKIPDTCTVWLDIRFLPREKNEIKKRVLKLMPRGFTSEEVVFEPPLQTSNTNSFVLSLSDSVKKVTGHAPLLRGANGTSDSRFYGVVDIPGVEFGPIGDGMGSDTEWIDLPSLKTYRDILTNFLLQQSSSLL